jgi:sulfur carrier protein ThiS
LLTANNRRKKVPNNIIVQVSGGTKQVLDGVYTVADVKRKMGTTEGYSASINGNPAQDGDSLDEGDVVTIAKAVKGGQE